MAKRKPEAIDAIYPILEDAFSSAKRLGILEGSAAGDGYHHSRDDLLRRGKTRAYSLLHELDKKGKADAASALDLGLNDAQMIIASKRLHTATLNKDPRLAGKLAEWGGTLDGDEVTAMDVDGKIVSGKLLPKYIEFDRSHLTHIHLGGHRNFADDAAVWKGIADVVCGVGLPKPDPAPFKVGQRVEVNVDVLNGRIKPDGDIRAQYKRGEEFTVTAIVKGKDRWWAKGISLYWAADMLRKAS